MLSHPLLVEAIESEFVPCCVYNNKKGRDARVLERYQEPAWNNPVVRFVDAAGKDLIPRKDRTWSLGDVAARMIKALDAASKDAAPKDAATEAGDSKAPLYLRLLAAESRQTGKRRAIFAMHCFWEGEARLGALAGVIATRAGWLDRKEVVEVCYDESRISFRELVKTARRLECASTVFARDRERLDVLRDLVGQRAVLTRDAVKDAKPGDRLYYLRKSVWNVVPAIPIQRTRMNAALARRQDPRQFLSPRQRATATLVLRADPKKLEGLEPPEDVYELNVYEAKLRKRIGGKPE